MLGEPPMRRSRELPRLGGKPEALSDAISRIFAERASFELREDDVEALRKQLRNGGISPSLGTSALIHTQHEAEELAAWRELHPSLLTNLPKFFQQAKGKRLTVFMDYDGTLTPIVKDPDRAFMSDQMRGAVRSVAGLFPTAIISGRGREKVEEFVKLKELFYAGSHGMDIVGPQIPDSDREPLSFQAAAKFAPVMDSVYASLVERTKPIPGASVEHNKFCVSVHFRNCEPDRLEEVVGAVEAVLSQNRDLKATRGRKVLEIRPEVEWNKGHALAHLLTALELGDTHDVMPIYIGDDRTDEDAFAVLNQRTNGVGILVSSKVKPTEAVYALRDPTEVMSFLLSLVSWGHSMDNGWHASEPCCGWRLNADAFFTPRSSVDGGGCAPEAEAAYSDHRRSFGKPPIFPVDKSWLNSCHGPNTPESRKASGRPPGASAEVQPPEQRDHEETNGMEPEIANSVEPNHLAARGSREEPASPFQGQPMWADTLASRHRQDVSDTLSTEAVEGSEASQRSLDLPDGI